MKKIFKFIVNFGPIIIFIFFYYLKEKNLLFALYPLIGATLISNIANILYEKKIALIPLVGCIIICFFGGLSIYFNNPLYVYIRPTIIHSLIGLFLLFGNKFLKEIPIKKFLGKIIKMQIKGWKILNNRFVIFIFFMAFLNEVIWRTQTEEIWVNFKVWGGSLITLLFCLFQTGLINFYLIKKKN
jgi:intracellular septation protein